MHHRFIPAGAGNTAPLRCGRSPDTVYPRWRGEHCPPKNSDLGCSGLSPLARGTLRDRTQYRGDERFIPAGAGNTLVKPFWFGYLAVYPRWRGEHICGFNEACSLDGLSPLARGTPSVVLSFLRNSRFIPAGAGNTTPETKAVFDFAVYPRWRGEHGIGDFTGINPGRFIPAGAGNTNGRGSVHAAPPVYPRWRGEHRLSQTVCFDASGLSPLARGTPYLRTGRSAESRFIPAGAGNTR